RLRLGKLPLSRIGEPLLIIGRRLPALVRRAGADQVHIGAEVSAVRTGAVAWAVGTEAIVVGGHVFEISSDLRGEIAVREPDPRLDAVGFRRTPQALPGCQTLQLMAPDGVGP